MNKIASIQKNIADNVIGKIRPAHDDRGHHYELVDDGVIVDSVTTKYIVDKPQLLAWAGRLSAEYALENAHAILSGEMDYDDALRYASRQYESVRDTAGGIGTLAHDLIERFITDMMNPDIPSYPVVSLLNDTHEPKVWAAVRAAEKFLLDKDIQPLACELLVGDKKLGVAGTLDLLAMHGDKVVLIDWKTSNAMFDGYAVQASIYAELFTRMTGIVIDEIWVAHLSKQYDAYKTYLVKNPKQAIRSGKAIYSVYDWLNNSQPKFKKI